MDYKEIKTFEDACNALEILAIIPELGTTPEEFSGPILAHYKLMVIAKAINGDWKPDWSDSNQWKYYPWFDMRSSASGGFSYDGYDCWDPGSGVGSRLCFESREKAEYAGTQFKDLYEEYFVIKE
jgi:hypothetical protein